MKLTEKQKEALLLLKEEKSISKDRFNYSVMYALYLKNLVILTRCANGEFWNLTDEGIALKIKI